MYQKGYGIVETLAPVHVGATAGEENGNLNLISRDQFTQTGIILGSSIRGRLRADMRQYQTYLEKLKETGKRKEVPPEIDADIWYGKKAEKGQQDTTTEALIKLEYASVVWLPVFCPGQPIVWVSCPSLLKRYHRITKMKKDVKIPTEYTASKQLWKEALESQEAQFRGKKFLFFNLGFIKLEGESDFSDWFPLDENLPAVVVNDNDMGMIHDMALYRQSRVALEDDMKRAKKGQFFNTEALPEGTILAFPIAIRHDDKYTSSDWKPINGAMSGEIYLGGLESIGFGHCNLTIKMIEESTEQ